MTTRIAPSDSYIRFLVPPISHSAPEHMKKIIPGYIITHVLGSGGFATVYKAINPDGWEVAVKIPKIDDLKKTLSMDVIEKFKFESDIWRNLKQEHIVDFFDSNTIPLPYISMELMEGGDLDGLMRNHKLTVEEAVHIMLQVLEGMSYAHRMASVHRDLKPENILFSKTGVAKITDWGIGKYMASEGITKTIETKGTLAYSSPEQFDPKKFGKVDWQTDIFQLGTVFYEMLTGVNPFSGPRMPGEVIGRVLNHDPEPPSSHNGDIPPELDDIVMGALEKDKKKRWDSGAVMLFQLKGVVEGKKLVTRVERKGTGEKGQSEGVMRELQKQFGLLQKIGVDTSGLEREMKPIEKYSRLRWYDRVIEQGNVLLEELKTRYKKELERRQAQRKALMEKVRGLFEECLSRELDIEHLYDANDEAMEAYERGDHEKAERLFLDLKKDLERLIDEDDRREAVWKEFDRLKANRYGVLPPPGLEDLIERDVYRAEGKLVGWADAIEKARKEEERRKREEEERIEREKEERRRAEAERRRKEEEQRRREDEARRRAEAERKRREEEERHRRHVQGLGEKANQLNKKRAGYGINIDNLREDLQSATTLLKRANLQKAEDKYNEIIERLENAINAYETEQEAAERARIREQQRKRRNKMIAITSIIVVVLLIGSSIGGYIWYSWDSDDDGIRDAEDAFPDDPAASIDTDGDGWPDEWNFGKSSSDSTSKPRLLLDAFPDDSQEWKDADGDGYGDNKADKFPDDKYEWADSDNDGVGDNSDIAPNDNTIQEFSDLNFEWVDISSGNFWMGSYPGDGSDDERPRHQVTISKGFQMLKFEVTQSQWEAVMGSNPSHFSGDNNPVEWVSWNDCQSFISKLNELDPDYDYRLPTEAEWEYACRAGSTTTYSYGNDSGQLGQYAWYGDNSNSKTHPVGEKDPNPWGLYDMHGNVWEWCEDWYDSDYYENSPGTDPQGPDSGSARVVRGGSWYNYADNCRSAYRYNFYPAYEYYGLGLRLVRLQASREAR